MATQRLFAFSKNDSADRVLSISANKFHNLNHQFTQIVEDTLSVLNVRFEYIMLYKDLFPVAEKKLFETIYEKHIQDVDKWKFATAKISDMFTAGTVDRPFYDTLCITFSNTTLMLSYLKQLQASESV